MLILHNAHIYSSEVKPPFPSALAIENGRIQAMGGEEGVISRFGSHARLQNLEGKTIWPGLIDAHLHLEHYALSLQRVDCETKTLAECLKRVKAKAREVRADEWVLGHGWNQNDWTEGFGNAELLDSVAPENPVYLTSKSLHSSWTNSRGLALAQITRDTPDTEGGKIQRDSNNQPTGILFESAVQLVEKIIPPPSLVQLKESINHAQEILLKMGVTCVNDFDSARCFEALQLLQQEGNLKLRVVKGVPLTSLPHAIELGLRSGFGNDHLRIGPVKLFADGALGPQTAAMLQPYEGESDTGILALDAEQIMEYGSQAVEHGLSLAIHAIGDRANHAVLDAYAQIRHFEADNRLPTLRHRIEHVQLIHPDDQARLSTLGIIASMQPIHAPSDMLMADRYWGSRCKDAYAWRAVLQNKVVLAFGSDAPVESPNPFRGLHAAVTRQRQDGTPGPEGWYPEQKISLAEGLQAYTTGAAFVSSIEDRVGKIEAGYLADLIVLPKDPMSVSQETLFEMAPEATMIDGEWAF